MAMVNSIGTLPAQVKTGLDRFCKQIEEVASADLVSLILYGGLARGEYSANSSNVNVLIVVKKVTLDLLDRISGPVQTGAQEIRLSVMTISEEELQTSTDVFPIKFLEMQRHHQVLAGSDPFNKLDISREHLRLRCEQELKNLLFRLRQLYLFRHTRPEQIEMTIQRSLATFMQNLAVLIELKNGKTFSDFNATIDAVGELGIDSKRLRDLRALKSGELKPSPPELKLLYESLITAVEQAATLTDKL